MKKLLSIFLIFTFCKLAAQRPDSTIRVFMPDNHYGPFHQTIKDTVRKTVSDLGHYVSIGIGGGHAYGIHGACAIFSYSIAYKSLIFSLTRAGSSVLFAGGGSNDYYYRASYFGFLIGQAVRYKNFTMALSIGIANSNMYLAYPDRTQFSGRAEHTLSNTASFPIELKMYVHANNFIGIGLHLSENILSPSQYSPFYFGASLVFGYWNKIK